jgi:dihydroorotase
VNIILRNAIDTNGKIVEVVIEDGKIALAASEGIDYQVVDCTGLHVLPGFVDLHTHLREPGFEQSETILTGSMAAAAGGYTAVHAMANTFPVADTAGVVDQIWNLGRQAGLVHVQPVGAITVGLKGEQLAEIGAMAESRAKVSIFSDDGNCLSDSLLMRRALEYVKSFDGVIAQHAQDPRLTQNAQMNEGELSARLGLSGWPAVAEESIIARDIMLAEHVGSRLHVCHVSTAGSVELIRQAKQRGVKVSAEVTPHHLSLTEDLASGYDPLFKVNPPLRTAADVLALRFGLVDGTIDVIATDHAPHPKEAKDTEWAAASFGMLGLETAFAIALEVLVISGASSLNRLAEVMSTRAAEISGLAGQGRYLSSGARANLTLANLDEKWISVPQSFSRSENNPFVGRELTGRVIHTIYDGNFSYRDGNICQRGTHDSI